LSLSLSWAWFLVLGLGLGLGLLHWRMMYDAFFLVLPGVCEGGKK
jgi:hypothetical protein